MGHKLALAQHQWSEWKTTTKPSCTTEGEETRQCSVCQETETRKLEKTDHDWSDDFSLSDVQSRPLVLPFALPNF